MDKHRLTAAFRRLLQERLDALDSGSDAARQGTRVDGDHRPANRGERAAVTAQGYLAHGLAERAAALRADLALLDEVDLSPADRVRAGALVQLQCMDGHGEHILILPGGHGDPIDGVTVISPASPMAKALRGKAAGELVRIRRGGEAVDVEIDDVG
ncbi:MAG: GreA/GreB family elongation factor [Alphaproteobacteria bacterium]|nr:GreA/GreB family elongation factor [Alphaproteobacteria bacterium]